MRVAYICADPGVPVFGSKGASIHVQEVLSALIRLGAKVKLFASAAGGDKLPELEGMDYYIPSWPKGDHKGELLVHSANKMLRSLLEITGPFDLVYERYSLWSYAGMEYADSLGVPGVLEVNAPLIEEQARYRHLADRECAERVAERAFGAARHLFAVSSGVANYLARYKEAKGKVHLLPNGVNPVRFGGDIKPSRPAKHDTFTIGFMGSLKPWHGLEILVDAYMHLNRKAPNTRLLVVGDGPQRESLERDLEARNLITSTEFTGMVTAGEIPGLLASMDVGVAPYPKLNDFYFSPLKIYEYMAAGLPVVASRIGDLPELIENGVNGYLVPPGDPVVLADVLEKLRSDPTLRISIGNAARSSVLSYHTWDMVVRRILDLSGIAVNYVSGSR